MVCCYIAQGKPYDSLSSHTGTNTRSKLFHLEGDPDHPVSRGALCPKGAGALDYVNGESRALYPEYRAPGSDKWETSFLGRLRSNVSRLLKMTVMPTLLKRCRVANR